MASRHKPKWSPQEQEVIRTFAGKIKERFGARVQRIILYGSRARGDAQEDSDYDFLVLLDPVYEGDRAEVSRIGSEVSYDYNVLAVTRTIRSPDFSEDNHFYFYENVMREGVDL